ncbi:MAG: hypothetical protein ACE5GX_17985 [Thermoanaerobaculia bacterium]
MSTSAHPTDPSLPVRKKLLFSLIVGGCFFALLEGGLALFGVTAGLAQEDPFVGFTSNIPLFVEAAGRPGEDTAPDTSTAGADRVSVQPEES